MLDKTYSPADVEAGRDIAWETEGAFRPKADGEPYCIMMPPPNVTGSLHVGHALNHTVQDTLARFHRMRGKAVLWQPGTDHASIAVQMLVERQLDAEGTDRQTLGREAFLERCWLFKQQSGNSITSQLRSLGTSPDWSRERFTMDPGLSRAVTRAFVHLHRDGLIHKDRRLVNWDCELKTAISDLEVNSVEVQGKLWHIRYPLEDGSGHVTVATTRPETMLGDTAVAVHPDDERYQANIGKRLRLPLVGRSLPIVADDYSDPEKGTGAVKITPAHDFNDFEVGRRHDLEAISILDREGRITAPAPEAYVGLDRFKARKAVVADLEAQGFLVEIEDHTHMVPFGDRSNSIIEPYLTDQWYCDAATLAKPAIEAVEQGRTRFVPEQWANTYFAWMRNIQPWCVSRQLWWGHRIPAWYGPDGRVFVAETDEEAAAAASAHYGSSVDLVQDEDVLDTWFSSGLWAFSTLDWPDGSPELERFYPTSVLVTGFDIIFFWVARMMMFGLYFMNQVPFRDVYIHGLVRDEQGQKMSKTKGNVIDPLELIETYGTDALRFTILASLAQGRDIKFGTARVQGYRNFVTKLWNAARFCEMNRCRLTEDFSAHRLTVPLNRWIATELIVTVGNVTRALETYRFNDAALGLYQFVWDRFCDWYLELAKPVLAGADQDAEETRATAAWVMDQILLLLHPMMPFVSEHLSERLFGAPHGHLITAPWPAPEPFADEDAARELSWLVQLIGAIRAIRAELRLPPAANLDLLVGSDDPDLFERLQRHRPAIERLARVSGIEPAGSPPAGGHLQIVVDEVAYFLPVGDSIDLEEERARLAKEIDQARQELAKIDKKLGNEAFLAKAPDEVVAVQRERRAETEARLGQLQAALERIT
ncbi:MAG: valine--tRNA ligase [Geminicoccaceae bacterium]